MCKLFLGRNWVDSKPASMSEMREVLLFQSFEENIDAALAGSSTLVLAQFQLKLVHVFWNDLPLIKNFKCLCIYFLIVSTCCQRARGGFLLLRIVQRIKGGISLFSVAACGKGFSWARAGSGEGEGPPLPLRPAAPAYTPPHPCGHGVPTHPWAIRPFPRSAALSYLCLCSSCFGKPLTKLPSLSSNEKVELWVN